MNGDERAFTGTAAEVKRPAQSLHPVAQANQTRAAGGIGAAGAVVVNRQVQEGVALLDGDVRL